MLRHVRGGAFWALSAAAWVAGLTPVAQAAPPAHPITNIDTWSRFVRWPATRPVDIVILAGDSTIIVNRGGQARALHEVLGERYPAFATSFMSPGINNGAGVQLNMGWDWADLGVDQTTGAPGVFDEIFQRTESAPLVFDGHFTRYGHIPADLGPFVLYGAQLGPASRLDLRGAIRFDVWYSAGPGSAGSFCPQIRYNNDTFGGYTSLSTGTLTEPIPTDAATDRVARFSATLAADGNRSTSRLMYWNVGGNIEVGAGATTPITFYGTRAYAEDVRKGYSISIVDQCGSESDYGMAVRARDWLEHGVGPDGRSPSYELLIGALRQRQIEMGFSPRILMVIQGMGNSYIEDGRSINDVAPNRSTPGVEDNVTDLYYRWDKFRARAGYSADEFGYLLVGFTVVKYNPQQEKFFDACRKRLAAWTRGKRNVCFLDWSGFMTPDEARLWASVDEVHLTLEGYKAIWRRAINHGLAQPVSFNAAPVEVRK